jgi:hypothetical protein
MAQSQPGKLKGRFPSRLRLIDLQVQHKPLYLTVAEEIFDSNEFLDDWGHLK